ncbi:MAG: SGNH/GDSL hydrolase family protein [Coraliomargarita sp.]|nr:SGNH/GDSL hydrolase family protein [Coraliomargarita sp.]
MFLDETSPFKFLFIGDSITDCGRDRSTHGDELGDGYVRQVDALVGAHYPELSIKILNTGIGGNRVTDLEERWQKDVFDLNPDYLSIMIGINDVWRQFDSPKMEQVNLQSYTTKLEALIQWTLPTVKGIVVLSPFFLETNRSDPMRAQMDAYGTAAKSVAERNGLPFVDVQAAFDEWLKHKPSSMLCDDRVHPNHVGHNIIASAFLNAIGFEW